MDGLVGIEPPDGERLPTNGVIVLETVGELRVEGERRVGEDPPESLTPFRTRCAGKRCFTPVPVGPLPTNADLVVDLQVGREAVSLAYDVGPVADRDRPEAATVEGGPRSVRVRVSDNDVTIVLVEDADTGAALAGALGPASGEDLRLTLESLDPVSCVSTLTMDRGGNVVLGEERCF